MAALEVGAIEVNPFALNITGFFAAQEPIFALEFSLAALFFGVLTTLTFLSIFLLLRRPKGPLWYWSIRIPLAGTILLYLSTGVYMAAFTWNRESVSRIVSEATDGLYSKTYDGKGFDVYSEAVLKQSWMATVALGSNIVLGDAIVWWRACLIWRHKAIYWTGPILVAITLGLAAIGTWLNHRPGPLTAIYFIFGSDGFSTAGVALSLFTNLVATSMIAYKAWFHRRRLQKYLGADGTPQTRVLRVLALLVESGTVYCVILIFVLIFQPQEKPTTVLSDGSIYFLYGCLAPMVAIYPTVIVVLTAANSSPLEQGLSQSQVTLTESVAHRSLREQLPPNAVRLRRCTLCSYEEGQDGKDTVEHVTSRITLQSPRAGRMRPYEPEADKESWDTDTPIPNRRSDSNSIINIV